MLNFQFLLFSFPANFSNSVGVNHCFSARMHLSPETLRGRGVQVMLFTEGNADNPMTESEEKGKFDYCSYFV